jgi:flagellar biosynthesis anti-sigma factor FlgM
MRIDPEARIPQAQHRVNSGKTVSSGAAEALDRSGAGNDSATLSVDQAKVQALASAVYQLPEIRQEKVAALSRSIREGNYHVTPEQTAEALVSQMGLLTAA